MIYPCPKCNKSFKSMIGRNDHLKSLIHTQLQQSNLETVTQFRCCDCCRDFGNEQALSQHLKDKIHHNKPVLRRAIRGNQSPNNKTANEATCHICNKSFTKPQSLKQHKNSQVHRPLCAPWQCIGGNGCKQRFSSPSSMFHHLESGSCLSGVTRQDLNMIVAKYDSQNQLMSPTALESVKGTAEESFVISETGGLRLASSPILSPLARNHPHECLQGDWIFTSPNESLLSLESMRLPRTESHSSLSTGWVNISPIESLISFESELSDGQEATPFLISNTPSKMSLCPLCPPSSNMFKTARDLNNHEQSPVHAAKIFHCPRVISARGRKSNAEKSFSTLSGLAMHVESGVCGKRVLRNICRMVNKHFSAFGIQEVVLLK